MNKMITISPSPHIHSGTSVEKLMYGVVFAMIPAFLCSLYFFGIGALIVMLTSVIGCMGAEFLINKYLLKKNISITDGSALVTGILLGFNVPSNLPFWIILIGSVVAIGVAKMSFGGLGSNPFNPALVGRVFLLVSFPVQMTTYPLAEASRFQYFDAVTGATPLSVVKEGLRNGETMSAIMQNVPSSMSLFIGQMGGSLGEVSAAAILIGLLYMLIRKVITWHIPVAVLGSAFLFSGILWLVDAQHFASPVFHLLTGGLMLGAVFMATDYVTSPMSKRGMLLYGCMIGFLTILIRTWGAYPEGISFAILIMNAFVPLINKYMKPKRFAKKNN